MATSFNHSAAGLVLGTSRTLIYGPVAAGITVVVYAGTFTNVDNTSAISHNFTLERYDGATYHSVLNKIPVAYGAASKCPKLTLLPGESLYGTADAASSISAAIEMMLRS